MLVHRNLYFARSLYFNEYGYISGGMSVANMAYELAIKLGHKNIILIGQDLAYDENGNSHPKEYLHTQESENDRKTDLFITAYGGNGKVETNIYWKLFKEILEKDIATSKYLFNTTTYNATEGGARIEGSIEKSFKELCQDKLTVDKTIFKPLKIQNKKIGFNLKKAKYNIEKILSTNKNNFDKIKIILNKIEKAQKDLKVSSLLRQIDAFKKQLYKKSNGAYELYPHILYHHELKINALLCKNPKNKKEQEQTIKELLSEYKETFETLLHLFGVFDTTIKNDTVELFQL
ncbi:TPA: motility associated factor glycosyltransferase family protein, partial [Campylobacter lari]|nr:motility associated factor glycosyltransferase family protein [Campylobacter lari]